MNDDYFSRISSMTTSFRFYRGGGQSFHFSHREVTSPLWDCCDCLTLIAFKTNAVKVNTFLSYSKCSKCLPPALTNSLNLFLKRGTALFCGKFPRVCSSATFNSETVWSFHKKQRASLHPKYLQGVQIWRVGWLFIVSSESFTYGSRAGIVERHVLCHVHRAPFISLNLPHRLESFVGRNWETVLITVCINITTY